ncbi:MAG: thiamine diphosphokinase [Eubacteriales bacterium]|nr:thiamine diphosphokinase [Eubacteriales bacterium]
MPDILTAGRHRIVIVLSGQIASEDGFRDLVHQQDVLICADGGARHLHRIGLLPDRLVGDLDSINPDDLAWIEQHAVPIVRFPSIKDETDAELAVEASLAVLCEKKDLNRATLPPESVELVFLAVLGGRPDHVLANQLMAVKLAERGYPVLLSDGQSRMIPVVGPAQLSLEMPTLPVQSWAVSAIPISPVLSGLTYTGLKYPLDHATLERGSCRGVSNRPIIGQSIEVDLERGSMLVIITPEV